MKILAIVHTTFLFYSASCVGIAHLAPTVCCSSLLFESGFLSYQFKQITCLVAFSATVIL